MEIALTVGRLFSRTNQSGVGLLGVVETPQELDTEGLHACIIEGGAIIVDSLEACAVVDTVREPVPASTLRELNADYFFYHLYASDPGGVQEFFFRQTALPSSTPGMKWCYITGARRHALPQAPEDGMYELGSRLRKIEMPAGFGNGMTLGGLLREPVWGPAGAYGLGHTLEVGFYPSWVEGDRARNARRDPRFARFMAEMAEHGETPLYFTAAQREERDALCDQVLRQMLATEERDYTLRPRGR